MQETSRAEWRVELEGNSIELHLQGVWVRRSLRQLISNESSRHGAARNPWPGAFAQERSGAAGLQARSLFKVFLRDTRVYDFVQVDIPCPQTPGCWGELTKRALRDERIS